MDRWTEIELFVQVAELGSLSRAAESLGLSNAAASRHLAALEARLAARLVQRNTRRLFLTDVGDAFYRRCKPLLGELQEAETAVNEAVLKPTGLLRIQASLSFSMIVIAPLLPEFSARYPDLRVEIVASNRYADLLEGGIDVAIRNREFENDSAITVRRLAETKRVLAASPQYLQRHGTPRTPDELKKHRLLIYNLANHPNELRLTRDGIESALAVQGVLEANDGQIVRAAALKHLGILMQPMYIIHGAAAARVGAAAADDQHRLPDAKAFAGQGALLCRLPGRAVRGAGFRAPVDRLSPRSATSSVPSRRKIGTPLTDSRAQPSPLDGRSTGPTG
jgi:DNA-binding transcriptional LysR family regulator